MKKNINYLLVIIILIWDLFLFKEAIVTKNFETMSAICTLPLVFTIPFLVRKVLKINISSCLETIFIVFVFLAQFLGSCVNLYDQVFWYDIFTHFLSGIFSGLIALEIFEIFKKDIKKDVWFYIIFIFGIVFIVAGCWEFLEFLIDKVTGSNMQHAIDTKVDDTMTDMLSAAIGGIIFNLVYFLEVKSKKDGIILNKKIIF